MQNCKMSFRHILRHDLTKFQPPRVSLPVGTVSHSFWKLFSSNLSRIHTLIQANLFQNHLCLHQLTQNMTKECSLIYPFSKVHIFWEAVNDRKFVFHLGLKPNIWSEKHLALGQIPKPKLNVQIHHKITSSSTARLVAPPKRSKV